jgi:hypothetical protein
MVQHHCAAGALYGVANAPFQSVQHRCLNCRKPMHGALCGVLYCEKGEDIKIPIRTLTTEGRCLIKYTSAVICNRCIDLLNVAGRKSPPRTGLDPVQGKNAGM